MTETAEPHIYTGDIDDMWSRVEKLMKDLNITFLSAQGLHSVTRDIQFDFRQGLGLVHRLTSVEISFSVLEQLEASGYLNRASDNIVVPVGHRPVWYKPGTKLKYKDEQKKQKKPEKRLTPQFLDLLNDEGGRDTIRSFLLKFADDPKKNVIGVWQVGMAIHNYVEEQKQGQATQLGRSQVVEIIRELILQNILETVEDDETYRILL